MFLPEQETLCFLVLKFKKWPYWRRKENVRWGGCGQDKCFSSQGKKIWWSQRGSEEAESSSKRDVRKVWSGLLSLRHYESSLSLRRWQDSVSARHRLIFQLVVPLTSLRINWLCFLPCKHHKNAEDRSFSTADRCWKGKILKVGYFGGWTWQHLNSYEKRRCAKKSDEY